LAVSWNIIKELDNSNLFRNSVLQAQVFQTLKPTGSTQWAYRKPPPSPAKKRNFEEMSLKLVVVVVVVVVAAAVAIIII
jgi:hypothetical protein